MAIGKLADVLVRVVYPETLTPPVEDELAKMSQENPGAVYYDLREYGNLLVDASSFSRTSKDLFRHLIS